MSFAIRPFHASDMCALYRICLRTGNSGQDASTLYTDPELMGHYYAGPYAALEPDLCFVATRNGDPCGYVLGTRDSAAFGERCQRDWFPPLRQRYPLPDDADSSPDARLIRLIHAGYRAHPGTAGFPAHLHIDLLPIAQGQGLGRALIETLAARLRELDVPAVHLGVGRANASAVGFYERLGFERIVEHETWIAFGMRLSDPS